VHDERSSVDRYKDAERRVLTGTVRMAAGLVRPVVDLWQRAVRAGNQKLTIMIVPHSQRKVVNVSFSVFGLLFVCGLLATLLVVSLALSTGFTRTNERFLDASRALAASEATVESMTDEVKELQRVVIQFRQSLERVLGVVGTDTARGYLTGGVGGDLASFVSESLVIASDVRSLTELRSLRTYLEAAIGPLQEIEGALLAQRELLVDIPSLWPIVAGKGYITNDFGPAIHPFNRRWYIHKGIDIAWLRGTEIVATANGRVLRVGYEPYNLGHFVIVKHKYGFATVYGHLSRRPLVKAGQQVARGEVLGYLGSTGLSTGPHVHYEVWIAEQVVNPRQFLSIVNSSPRGAVPR
jgi:murein DD-endopeptidase MepM/ murein hydrolase activator NlpD